MKCEHLYIQDGSEIRLAKDIKEFARWAIMTNGGQNNLFLSTTLTLKRTVTVETRFTGVDSNTDVSSSPKLFVTKIEGAGIEGEVLSSNYLEAMEEHKKAIEKSLSELL